MLRDFSDESVSAKPSPPKSPPPPAIPSATHLLKQDHEWDHRELHAYVSAHMHPDAVRGDKDHFIFMHFMKRWGERGVAIARYAFEIADGIWHGEHVRPSMFSKGFDPYFAVEIDRILSR